MYYCWSCYGHNHDQHGPCVHCGREISPPPDADRATRLIWALRHPDPDVAVLSTRRLARLSEKSAIPALRKCITQTHDPYLAAEALRSLVVLSTPAAERELLEGLATDGPVLLREQARKALAENG